MKIDDWFKPAILILAVIFLFIFGLHALKGRYRPIFDDFAILDTFTGNVYKLSGERAFLNEKKFKYTEEDLKKIAEGKSAPKQKENR